MKTLTNKDKMLLTTIRQAVFESVHEALNDPDLGLELRPEVKKRLLLYRKNKNRKLIPLAEIKKKHL